MKTQLGLVFSTLLILTACGGGIGMKGSPAWYATAPKEAIKEYEEAGGKKSNRSVSARRSGSTTVITSGNQTVSCRTSSSGRNTYCSDGTTYRTSSSGRMIYGSDGTTYRQSSSGRMVYGSDGTTYRRSSNGRTVYGSDGSICRTSSSGRYTNCW